MDKLTLEDRVAMIEVRNKKVELDKNWKKVIRGED